MKAPHDVNTIAVVDRKIQSIKKAISGAMMEDEMSELNINWVRLLPDIVAGLNESQTEALHGKVPEDIKQKVISLISRKPRRGVPKKRGEVSQAS